MSKAEEFIRDYTRGCSNELIAVESKDGKEVVSYHEWLTPDQARCAVELAKEEMIEKVCKYLDEHLFELWEASCPTIDNFVEKFKQAMKDET